MFARVLDVIPNMFERNSESRSAAHALGIVGGLVSVGAGCGGLWQEHGAVVLRVLEGLLGAPLLFLFGYVLLVYGPIGATLDWHNDDSRNVANPPTPRQYIMVATLLVLLAVVLVLEIFHVL